MSKPKPNREYMATKIANDIAEGIDCGESKAQLRDAVAWWAEAYAKLAVTRQSEKDDKLIQALSEAVEVLEKEMELAQAQRELQKANPG